MLRMWRPGRRGGCSVHVAEDGSVAVSARLPAAEGPAVLQALRAAAGDCEHPHRPHGDTAEDTGPAQDTVPAAGDRDDSGRAEPGRLGPAGRAWPMRWWRWPGRTCRGISPPRATRTSTR